jgi:ATP-dependent Clp protease, protease subunit
MKTSFKKTGCEDCEEPSPMSQPYSLPERTWEGLLPHKKILINGIIDESLIEKAVIQIFLMNGYDKAMKDENPSYQAEPIIVYINSSGGALDEAFSLVSAIEASDTPVVTVALGKAYSAGFLILLAGHARYAQSRSTLMYHQGSAGIGGEFSKIIEYAEHWRKCQNIVDEYVMKKTKIKKKQLESIYNNRTDSYMSADTAISLGVIDGVWKY